VISATVPEAKQLLDDAGIAVEYPKSMEDVKALAKSVQGLGPKYALIKREIFDEDAKKTTLHYVLCGSDECVVAASTFENVRGVTGLSYSIPCKQSFRRRRTFGIIQTDHESSGYCGQLGKWAGGATSCICSVSICARYGYGWRILRKSVNKSSGQSNPRRDAVHFFAKCFSTVLELATMTRNDVVLTSLAFVQSLWQYTLKSLVTSRKL
jgi:hypothetical protein